MAEIQVAPSPPGTDDDPHAHVEAAIAAGARPGSRAVKIASANRSMDSLTRKFR